MSTWVFVRHGQSEANRDGWYAGAFDSGLTDLGRAQAEDAQPKLFTSPPSREPFARAVCSDLSRAHDTAKILLQGQHTPLTVTDQLRERSVGAWEQRPIATVRAAGHHDRHLRHWNSRPPEGESLCEVALRATRWLAALPEIEAPTLVVSHGALMRSVLLVLDGRATETVDGWHPDNCEAVVREVPAGAWGRAYAALCATGSSPPSG